MNKAKIKVKNYIYYECLANKWLVHSWFIGLNNPLEVQVYHLLIGGMTDISYRDEFPMVSAIICMVTHWKRPIMSHNLRL